MLKRLYLPALMLVLAGLSIAVPASGSGALLLEYQREFSMIEEADNAVDLRVFANGTVEVHYPIFMRLAGDYRYQLSPTETDNLVQSLQRLGLDRFDAPLVRSALQLEQRAAFEAASLPGQSVSIITDPEIITCVWPIVCHPLQTMRKKRFRLSACALRPNCIRN